jgi:hypothetical protein
MNNDTDLAHWYFGEAEDDLSFMYEVHAKYLTSDEKWRPIEAKK